ncbi:MAG: nitrilase-related carbon-nitrogen hydrolase [candidate division WOR-3 bacterium]
MRIGFYQFCPIFGKKSENLEKIKNVLSYIKTDLIVLPELCNTGYSFQTKKELAKFAEPIPDGETTKLFINLAKKGKMAIVAGLPEKDKNYIYNSAILVLPSGRVFTYRKVHLFSEEKFIFTPGNNKFTAHKAGKVKIGMLICFDYIFPEATRSLALDGAQIICQPANLILPYAEQITVSRAIENRVFFIMANRTGEEKQGKKHYHFLGRSQIISPTGEILAKADDNEETVKIVNIYPDHALNKKVTKYNNVLKDRRPNLYRF